MNNATRYGNFPIANTHQQTKHTIATVSLARKNCLTRTMLMLYCAHTMRVVSFRDNSCSRCCFFDTRYRKSRRRRRCTALMMYDANGADVYSGHNFSADCACRCRCRRRRRCAPFGWHTHTHTLV